MTDPTQERNEEILAGEIPTREVLQGFLADLFSNRWMEHHTRVAAHKAYAG
jgi:hypothetical protein